MKKLSFTSRAKKDLKKLDQEANRAIFDKLQRFCQGKVDAVALVGTWNGWYKIRIGNYRALLVKEKKEQWIVGYIRHRKEAYKN